MNLNNPDPKLFQNPRRAENLSTAGKFCLILNPKAGSAERLQALKEAISNRADIRLRDTTRPGEARGLAAEAAEAGCRRVIACGGDGTINEVINGMAPRFADVGFGAVPLGTGNDLARTLDLPGEPREALALATSGAMRRLDLIKAEFGKNVIYGINMAAGGFTGQVDEAMTGEMKSALGPLAFLIGATKVLPELTDYETTVSWDGGPVEKIEALNIIVANGRTAAGGFRVAPTANPEDGLLDVVIVRMGSLVELAEVAARLLADTYLDCDLVTHRRTRRFSVASRPGMWFNIDGELVTREPITFAVQPRALQVAVGPGYAPESRK